MHVDTRWASRSAALRGLSYQFAVRCDDRHLGAQVDSVLAGLLASDDDGAPVEHWYSLTATPGGAGTFDVSRDDEPLARDQSPGDALGWIVWDVNRSAAEASAARLLFHAGALDAGGTAVLLPGPSGAGKSTLVAALSRAGLGYLTDELAALDLDDGRLVPYAKPITLKPGSYTVLPDLYPDPGHGPGAGHWAGGEWQVAVGGDSGLRVGGASAPKLVIVPRYEAGAPTRLTALSDTEAFLSIALHAVNLLPHGVAGTDAVARVVVQSSCYALTFSDLGEACALVLGLMGGPGATALPGARRAS